LSLPQLKIAMGALLGTELRVALQEEFEVLPSGDFRALDREGIAVTEALFATMDGVAARAGEYVGEHFSELSGCAEPATQDCVKEFVLDLAERAYRRPLRDAERESLSQVLTEAQALEATIEEIAQYGAYAVFESPGFVYRTEFGTTGDAAETPLAPYEVASQLSFFITGGPPDQALLDAAASDALSTPEAVAPHVDRLLSSEVGRKNLETAVFARLGVPWLDTVVIDPTLFPEFTGALRDAMRFESEAFVESTLWGESVGSLLTSRRSRVNQSLAELYGVEFPPAGVTPDALGFADVVLPETRSGLLTLAGPLTSRSRPEKASVVGRGVWVRSFLCLENPPFPDLMDIDTLPPATTEREKAEVRAATEPCGSCHQVIDPFGLVLDQFDAIGRFRTEDEMGYPIDPAVTLPADAGGQSVANAAELGAAVAEGPFVTCLTKSFFDYALAEGTVAVDGCEVEAVLDARSASADLSFSRLIREIATSRALSVRGARAP
jgi:hypothetical protein